MNQRPEAIEKIEKVHWTFRLIAFAASVVTLSWFFAGWRQIHEAGGVSDWVLLFAGIYLTALFLGLQAYWIYFEEKSKGTLKKRIEFFEKANSLIETRRQK